MYCIVPSTHVTDGRPHGAATVASAASGRRTRCALTVALQERLGLCRVEQRMDGGELIAQRTGDVRFGRHHRGRTRPAMSKRPRGEMLRICLLLLCGERKVKRLD